MGIVKKLMASIEVNRKAAKDRKFIQKVDGYGKSVDKSLDKIEKDIAGFDNYLAELRRG